MYDASGKAGPNLILWRGASGGDNITVITEDAFRSSVSNYEGSSWQMKLVWAGLAAPTVFVLWKYFSGQ